MKPEDVVAWREALTRLADQHFFDLMRMYLGAVRTPFNKQKLIEELSSFLRKKENRECIVANLDPLDLQILSAIRELPSPTQQKLVALFSGSRSFPEIYERILNLEERLLLYRRDDSSLREYAINPLLVDEVAPLLGFRNLFAPVGTGERVAAPILIDDLTLAAIYGFFLHGGEAVKNDGSFRKKTLESLESIFPQLYSDLDCSRFLLSALQNLGLLATAEGFLVPDSARWESFARLPQSARIAYLAASAGGRFQRESLQRRAQGFLDFFAALEPGALYSRETISRLAFLLSEKRGAAASGRAHGRFATMLRQQAEVSSPDADQPVLVDFADVAIAFGLLVENGDCWTVNSALDIAPAGSAARPGLVVSPSLSVTLMPGFSLSELLPLVAFMEVRDIQIAGQFEITRKSCGAAFDRGFTAESLTALLSERSAQPVPQSVLFSVSDWFRSYSAVSLYHGYVLKVDEGRRALFENDARLSSLIRSTLAPGVYLLASVSPEDIQAAFVAAGFDSAPSVSIPSQGRESLPLPDLRVLPRAAAHEGAATIGVPSSSGTAAHRHPDSSAHADPDAFERRQATLYAALDSLALPPDLDDALRSRIDRRIVLVPSQLDPGSVRVEKIEARGMDFLGKVRIAEYAIVAGSLLEIALDEKDGNRELLGRPLSCEKRTGDVILKIALEPDGKVEQISLGRAVLVRRIRGSIFSEVPQLRP